MTKPIASELSVRLDQLLTKPMQDSLDLNAVLAKLAGDDHFREQLLSDPVATLAGMGITVDPALIPAERTLPSKGSVIADQGIVRRRLETTNSMIIFLLSGND